MKKIILLLSILFFNVEFHSQNYVSSIENYSIYNSLKGKPLSDKFSNIESVKVIYSVHDQKLYFFNSELIRLHFNFVTDYLGYNKPLEVFNNENYSDTEKGRDFLLGNLNHIKGTDKWIFELAASDHMPVTLIEKYFKIIISKTYIGKYLKFYLNNREKLMQFDENKFKISCVKSDFIFNELKYQEVVSGSNIGILKFYKLSELDSIRPKANEIIVVDGTPETLPNVKGIIVSELQTPLSHLVILGKNRKIPIMAYTDILKDYRIKNLNSKKVELKIEVDTFFIKETSKKIGVAVEQKKKKLVVDNSIKKIVDLTTIPKNGVNFLGSKAQNMAYLKQISKQIPFKTPENAFGIPFYFYTSHVQKKSISSLISELLIYPNPDSTKWINNQLKKIRTQIKRETIDNELISQLNEKLGNSNFKNFRFRSSTNAEDIEGFNGAGLYESKTGIYGDSIKTFEKAIKQVWASVWNESSYYERVIFNIDQKNIAMGVLVHRAFPDELANGVVITKNLFRDNFSGITINVQKGENSVVKPEKNVICEQFTVYDFSLFDDVRKNYDVDYVSLSNLNENKPLLTNSEIDNLYNVSKKIERKMHIFWKKMTFHPVDIEFKIVGEKRELYIKQARAFND
jgi:pyruvate, water dikinase